MATRTKWERAQAAGRKVLRKAQVFTFAGALVARLQADVVQEQRAVYAWPSTDPNGPFRDNPERFANEVLGVELWSRQSQIADDVANNPRVVVRSGRKCGKTRLVAILALWFYCTRELAQVLILAVVYRQVQRQIWREIRMLIELAPVAIDGQLNQLASNGLANGFREIFGFTSTDREAVAGTSGRELFYILDESSGIVDAIYDTIEGNMMGGGAKLCAISNPTETDGWFFKLFHTKEALACNGQGRTEDWVLHTISSEEVADEVGGATPGLATRKEIEYHRRKYGEDSADFVVHVLGRHALAEELRAFSVGMVMGAQQRWDDADDDGPLVIGLDPAGDSELGDKSALAVRRAMKVLSVESRKGQTTADLVEWVKQTVRDNRVHPREIANLIYDVGGEIGAKSLAALRENEASGGYKLYPVRFSDNAVRHVHNVDKRSAELVWNFRLWVKAGGGIPEDEELYEEIRAWEFKRTHHDSEKVKVDKDHVRKVIKRSPDKFDSVSLACWDVTFSEERDQPPAPSPAATSAAAAAARAPIIQAPMVRPFDRRNRRV